MIFLIIIELFMLIGSAFSASESYNFISRHLGARSPYDQDGAPLKDPIVDDYDIEQMQLFIRHGVRYPDTPDQKAINNVVGKLKQSNSLPPEIGSMVAQYDPSKRFPASLPDELTQTGIDDLYQIGQRMGKKYAEFRSTLPLKSVENLASHANRSILSGQAFTRGFWEGSSNEPPVQSIPAEVDKTIDTTQNCPKYDQGTKSRAKAEMLKYYSNAFQPTATRISQELNLQLTTTDVYSLWYTCAYEVSIYKQVHPFCDFFTREELLKAEYGIDVKYSIKYSYASEDIVTGTACVQFKNLVANLQNPSQHRFVLNHGHSKTVLPLETKLGIHRDPYPLSPDASPEQIRDRQFRTSHDDMYGASFLLQLLRHKQSGARFIRVLVSETPTVIPACQTELCPLDRFMQIAQPLMDCNYQDACGN